MNRKVIFLDIDGTIVNYKGKIPQSAKAAIKQARDLGHLLVICTGRSKFQVYKELLDIGFDGIIAASGGYVQCGGKDIYHRYLPEENVKVIYDYLANNSFCFCAQTKDKMFSNKRCAGLLRKDFEDMGVSQSHIDNLLGNMEIREDIWNVSEVEKMVYQGVTQPINQVRSDLEYKYDITALSYHNQETGGEIGLFGINKQVGMEQFLQYNGLSRKDTIAVGDGPNDFEMLEFANVGIAMGNAIPQLKEAADYVTTDIDEDGIFNAFKHMGICD